MRSRKIVINNNIMNKCLKCGEYAVVYIVCCILAIFICYAFNNNFSMISRDWWLPVLLGIPITIVICIWAHIGTKACGKTVYSNTRIHPV